MRYLLSAILAMTIFAAVPASAACYTAEDAAADAAIRIHSELMVVALTCKYASDGSSLTDMYVNYGRRHNSELRNAEKQLINYYKRSNKSGIAELDRLRTILGNEYANEAAISDPLEWCRTASDRVVKAAMWSDGQYKQALVDRVKLTGKQMCSVSTQTASLTK